MCVTCCTGPVGRNGNSWLTEEVNRVSRNLAHRSTAQAEEIRHAIAQLNVGSELSPQLRFVELTDDSDAIELDAVVMGPSYAYVASHKRLVTDIWCVAGGHAGCGLPSCTLWTLTLNHSQQPC